MAGGVYVNASDPQPKGDQKTGSEDKEESKLGFQSVPGAKSSDAYIYEMEGSQLKLVKELKLDFQDSFNGDVVQNLDDPSQASRITLVGDNRIHYFDLEKQEFSSFRFTPVMKVD